MRVLVTGATGFVGGHLVPALLAADHEVSVLVRDRDGYDGPDEVAVFEGDLLEPGSFDDALEDIEAAYYLVHSMRAGADYADRDRRAARTFVAAAEDAGVEHVVYLGGLGEERDTLSEHLRSRREVEHILEDADFQLTSLRAAIIVGDGSASFEMVRQLAVRLPVMITPQWVDTPCQPIAIDDVVAYLVGVLDVPELAGRTVEIGGPEVMSYREVMARTAEIVTGRRPVIVPVPVLTPKLSAYWVNLVTDVPRSVAHPLILGLKNAAVVQDDSGREHLSIELTPFETAVRRAVDGGTDTVASNSAAPEER
ncbi:NADH-binding protein [Halorientalis sp. IM1011]|uniref:NAD(P)H-binding protein n=1 Tax=Halorientalis sp. IM1011 TaxID=1932360 RepID=UPI00097CD2D0|nr:NAD(P)H-binding protein [Halorientalis sp. IM1011]AQL42955.1 NADH-binding protein [Halorientalis sp. IM1011]